MNKPKRRLFVGDIHGCAQELEDLLKVFCFAAPNDSLYTVGDVIGRGPSVLPALALLENLGAVSVQGNHEYAALRYNEIPQHARTGKQQQFLDSLQPEQEKWIQEFKSWPCYLEFEDLILVHAGLQPGVRKLEAMDPSILVNIRTWDGKGNHLNNPDDPAWYELVTPGKPVIFGHWAKKGMLSTPGFKGLDTGCVYGNALSGYCPEEDRWYKVPSREVYSRIAK